MTNSWKDELKSRFIRMGNVCLSISGYDDLEMKEAIINLDSSLTSGLGAWLEENDQVPQRDKDRLRLRDCTFQDMLTLVQRCSGLDNDTRITSVKFREIRNKVMHKGYSPPRALIRGFLPSLSRVIEFLGIRMDLPDSPTPPSRTEAKVPPQPMGTRYSAKRSDSVAEYLRQVPSGKNKSTLDFGQEESTVGEQMPPDLFERACQAVGQRLNTIPFKYRGITIDRRRIQVALEILNAQPTRTLAQNCRNDIRDRTPDGLDRRMQERLNTDLRMANIISDVLSQAAVVEIVEVANPETGRMVKGSRLLPQWCW